MSNLSDSGAERVRSHTIPPMDVPLRLAARPPHRHDHVIEGAGLVRGPLPTIPGHGRRISRPGPNPRVRDEQRGEAQGRIGEVRPRSILPDAAERWFLGFEGIDGFLILSTGSDYDSNSWTISWAPLRLRW